MSTFLSKLFKPKWQSNNKSVRLEAVSKLDPLVQEQLASLIEVSQKDSDLEVRLAAVEKISDTEALIQLHKSLDPEKDSDLKQGIETRLQALANHQSLSIFDLIIDTQLITEMIVSSVSPEGFINGLARIESPEALLRIAQEGKTSKIRQAATELLESEQELKALCQVVKTKDKGVYQIAKTKLDAIRKLIQAEGKQKAQTESLIEAIEDLVSTDNTKQYEARVSSLISRWEGLGNQAQDAKTRFEAASQKCLDRINAQKAAELAEQEKLLLEQAGGSEQAATLLTLEETLKQFRDQPASLQEASSLDAILKTQETRWLEATRQAHVEKSSMKHYQVLMGELRRYFSSLQQLKERQDEMLDLVKQIQAKQTKEGQLPRLSKHLSQNLGRIDWPKGFAKPAVIADAEEALGHSQNIKEQQIKNAEEISDQIDQQMAKLDASLEERHIKKSATQLKEIQSLLSQLTARQSDKIHNQLNLRIKQLNELRDWQGFASSPRQLELCDLMERLADQTLPPQEKADKIKAMQSEWKSLGGAKDEALWLRFKAASDRAYEPCKAYFSEQGALKDNNLARRQTLLTQLSDFIAQNNWEQADWKAADQINRKARQEWRAAFPVDHKQNRPLQKQFNELLAKMDEHLSTERDKNLVIKKDIVARTEALLDLDDLPQAIEQAKALQKEWQGVGITEHKKDRALWKAFRKSCDAIFDKRDQARNAKREETEEKLGDAQSFLSEMATFLDTMDNLDNQALLDARSDFRKKNKQFSELPKQAAHKHQEKFESLINKLSSQIDQRKRATLRAQWQEVKRKSDILRAFYQDSSDVDAQEQSFQTQQNLPPELENLLKSRWIEVKAGAIKEKHLLNEGNARELCIRCEISSGIESPDSDQDLRMQLQVSRLSKGMSSSDHLSREEQLSELLKQWFVGLGLDAVLQQAFDSRIDRCVDALFGVKD